MPQSATDKLLAPHSVAPLRRRIVARAQAAGVPFELYLTRHAHAAFLWRLRHSSHAANLALKGAALLPLLLPGVARFTENLDLQQNHARLAVNTEALQTALRDVAQVAAPMDGLAFFADRLTLRPQRSPYGYAYTAALLPFVLGRSRHALRLQVAPRATTLLPIEALPPFSAVEPLYPDDLQVPPLRGTTAEQLLAEKLHLLHLSAAPSMPPLRRCQDVWDLGLMAQRLTLDGGRLLAALRLTFEYRQTPLPQQLPDVLVDAEELEDDVTPPALPPSFAAHWAHFLRTTLPQVAAVEPARGILNELLQPLYLALQKNHGFSRIWRPPDGWGNKG